MPINSAYGRTDLPDSPPRSSDFSSFWTDPLRYLRAAKEQHGNLVVLATGAPVFSRARKCSATVAVFGGKFTQLILADNETFEMPVSVSDRYDLPPPLKNLNSGLFSMHGERHRQRRRVLAPVLNSSAADANYSLISRGCLNFFEACQTGMEVHLVDEMRRFALHICAPLLLGTGDCTRDSLGSNIQSFFELRRHYAAGQGQSVELRNQLISQGQRVDRVLRERVRDLASGGPPGNQCVINQLMHAAEHEGLPLEEDEAIAHANILFMASSEPVATALTWALLLLTQQPRLRRDLRREFADLGLGARVPTPDEIGRASLLNGVVHEVLRLLPPSAILVRLSGPPSRIGIYQLPERCEFVLSPWVEHRDAINFPKPDYFLPSRWFTAQPRLLHFLPFGGGARSCLGKHLAMYTIKLGVQQMLARYDPVLSDDQELDWRMNLTLLPDPTPVLALHPVDSKKCAGTLRGPVATLVRFTEQ